MRNGTTSEREPFNEAAVYALVQAGLDRIDQAISVFDSNLRLIAWNTRFLELWGFPPSLIVRGAPFAELIRHNAMHGEYGPGDIENHVARRVRDAQRFQPHALERSRPDGTILSIRSEPLPGGGFVTVYTDITQQKHAETVIREQTEQLERRVEARTIELQTAHDKLLGAVGKQKEIAAALRISESRLLLVTDSLPAGIAYWDRDLLCLFANRRFAAAFGFDKSEIIGKPALDVVGQTTLDELGVHINTVRAGQDVTFEYQTTVDQGRPATIRTWLVPEIQDHNDVVGFFILSLDITRQQKAEAAILQAAKMEAIGQISSGIAHDFNNLLTIILGNLLPLNERGQDRAETADDISEFINPAIEAARKGADLTQRLLSFARRQSLEPRPVDIEALVGNMVRLFRRSLPNDIEIVIATKGEAYSALVDPHQLENALLNLALNARDAMPRGGQLKFETTFITLSAETAAKHGIEPGDYVQITVADTGTGMDGATRAKVFEPFFTTKRTSGGSGLGLSMVYGFVQQSRGAVAIDSQAAPGTNHGTRVKILLPRAEEVGEHTASPTASETFRAKADDLVLLVEDDDHVRAVIRRQLTDLGYRLIEATNGDDALELVRNVDEFTLLVSDIVMPGSMTGITLCAQAKATKPTLKIVLMTGYAGGERAEDLARCPFPVLHKPFVQQALVQAIRDASAPV